MAEDAKASHRVDGDGPVLNDRGDNPNVSAANDNSVSVDRSSEPSAATESSNSKETSSKETSKEKTSASDEDSAGLNMGEEGADSSSEEGTGQAALPAQAAAVARVEGATNNNPANPPQAQVNAQVNLMAQLAAHGISLDASQLNQANSSASTGASILQALGLQLQQNVPPHQPQAQVPAPAASLPIQGVQASLLEQLQLAAIQNNNNTMNVLATHSPQVAASASLQAQSAISQLQLAAATAQANQLAVAAAQAQAQAQAQANQTAMMNGGFVQRHSQNLSSVMPTIADAQLIQAHQQHQQQQLRLLQLQHSLAMSQQPPVLPAAVVPQHQLQDQLPLQQIAALLVYQQQQQVQPNLGALVLPVVQGSVSNVGANQAAPAAIAAAAARADINLSSSSEDEEESDTARDRRWNLRYQELIEFKRVSSNSNDMSCVQKSMNYFISLPSLALV